MSQFTFTPRGISGELRRPSIASRGSARMDLPPEALDYAVDFLRRHIGSS